ncbi:MAG: hypothetical protein COA69_01955 [Robiginitomaculum sp.]|nr:MAG: hypothetical protein COA69_01955 [Robiginitomaculum sp.]
MLTLISPAKKLDLKQSSYSIDPTEPVLASDTKILARTAKQQSASDLKKLMKLSDNLANLNADRFKAFQLNGRSNSAKPAALTFNGDVYGGLDALSLSTENMQYAQNHLRILSGLYGLLRPMDNIQPYRLEMGTRLENPRGHNLYQFWGSKIAENLGTILADHKDQTIVNLASNEYFKAVDRKALKAPVLSASFLNIKDGQAKSLMFYAKRARGLMARWIMENRVENTDDLRGFNLEGYKIDAGLSTEDNLVFTRKQPPTKS